MDPQVIHGVTMILANDPTAYASRRCELYYTLIPSSNDFYTANQLEPYSFFRFLLTQWISDNGSTANVKRLWEICENQGYKLIADGLKEKFPGEFHTSNQNNIDDEPVKFEVNNAVQNFTGRSNEMETLLALFHGTTAYIATITGMGGIGKSELAKRFAHHLRKEDKITIIWFNGQNRETLQASVNRLAKKIRTKAKDLKSRNMADSFIETVSEMPSKMKKRKLVIIDNVDEANEGAESLIKAEIPEKDCFFLITSRNLKVLKLVGEIIHLDIFPDADAQHLVSSSLKVTIDEDVLRLCKLLDNFPLALQQAVAYIREQKLVSSEGESYKISDYLDSFATMKKEYLGYELNFEHNYKLTTLITWQMTIDTIRKNADIGELAIAILSYIAYFQPDRIHMDFLKLFFKDRNVLDIEKAVQLIRTYSLVKAGKKLVSIHRLLQQVVQLNTFDKNLEVQRLREISNFIVMILEDAENEIRRIKPKLLRYFVFDENGEELEPLKKDFNSNPLLNCIRSGVRHLISVWDHNRKHTELITDFRGIPTKIIDGIYPLRITLPRINEVTYLTKTCFSLFKTTFGPNAKETLELESEVAFASGPKINKRKLKKLDEIYERQSSILGVDNVLNLKLLEKISYSIILEGCYSSNEIRYGKYLQDFLRLREKISGRGHESTFPVRWQLIEELEGKDPELVIKLIELVNDVPPQDKEKFLKKMKEYGASLFGKKKWVKANYMLELWLGFKGTEETWEVTVPKWTLSLIQHCLGEEETAFQTFAHAEFGECKDVCLELMMRYGCDLYKDKKMVKAKEIFELWLGFKGTEETKEITDAKWKLSDIQYSLGDRESALQTLQQALVGWELWEDREQKWKLFVENRSECERADGKVREGDLEEALRLYTRVADYQKNFPFPFSLNWWIMETGQKRASVLIQLRRWVDAYQILQRKVHWNIFVDSDHKLEIEKNELLNKAKEGLRLE